MNSRYKNNSLLELGFSPQALAGQTALITGGGTPLGREFSLVLARLGASLIIVDSSLQGHDTEKLLWAEGLTGRFYQTDVSCGQNTAALFADIRQNEGQVDFLINGAFYRSASPLSSMSISEWDKTMEVNLKAPYLCTRHALDLMMATRRGTIVHLFSAPSLPYMAAYSAAKQAQKSLVHSLAAELKDYDIHLTGYGLGLLDTPEGKETLKNLSSLMGLTEEAFLQSNHQPGYDFLVPVYDCAVILAHILCRPKDYHGQTIFMHEADKHLQLQEGAPPAAESLPYDLPQLSTLLSDIKEQSLQLMRALSATEQDFRRLPFLLRPFIYRNFRKQVGLSLSDLNALIMEIYHLSDRLLFSIEESQSDPSRFSKATATALLLSCSRIVSLLKGLARYYRDLPGHLVRLLRSEKALQNFAGECQKRERITRALLGAVDRTKHL